MTNNKLNIKEKDLFEKFTGKENEERYMDQRLMFNLCIRSIVNQLNKTKEVSPSQFSKIDYIIDAINKHDEKTILIALDTLMDKIEKATFDESDWFTLLTNKDFIKYNKKLEKSKPTDCIEFKTEEEISIVNSIWLNNKSTINGVPADLLFNNTIPLKDIYYSYPLTTPDNEKIFCNSRVLIFDDIEEKIKNYDGEDLLHQYIPIGINMYYYSDKQEKFDNDFYRFTLLGINPDYDVILPLGICYKGNKKILANYDLDPMDFFVNESVRLISWYNIQLMMLHPEIKVSINNVRENTKKSEYSYNIKKKKYIYVKRYNISTILDELKNKRMYNRTCKLWYVSGHYREYKNGKRIFIQGYFKGKDKDVSNDIEIRDRKFNI